MTDFWAVEAPFVMVLEGDAQVALAAAFSRTGKIAVARLDGAALENDDTVFMAFFNAFEFPEYFGWNWDALSDCLQDMAWYAADRYLVLIEHAELALAQDEEGRRVLFSILKRAASCRAESIPFKVVLHCGEEHVTRLREEVCAS